MSFSFFPSKNPPPPCPEDDAGANPPVQMPTVFVTPPEEDETPAWCFFDAENPTLSRAGENPDSPDIAVFAFPSDMEVPSYYANPDAMDADIAPRRSGISVVDALNDAHGDEDYSDTDSDYGLETSPDDDPQYICESARRQTRDTRNVADDSDVIEVVKVSRRSRVSEAQNDIQGAPTRPDGKRSQNLKSRASQVFKSLKGSLRSSSKPRAQDTPNAPPPVPPLPPLPAYTANEASAPDASRSRTPIVSRRGSKILSQLFTAPNIKSRILVSSFDDRSEAPSRNSTISPTASTFSTGNSLSSQPSMSIAAAQDEARLNATSPTPTASSTKSTARRLSTSLQKLFSFSSASQAPSISDITPNMPGGDSGRTTPTARSTTSTPPSVMSSTGPQTPTGSEEVNHVRLVSQKDTADIPGFDSFESVFDTTRLNLGLGLGLNLESELEDVEKTPRKPSRVQSLKQTWDAVAPRRFSVSKAPLPPTDLDDDEDTSLEMRLDSFHFDPELSFDVDKFIAT